MTLSGVTKMFMTFQADEAAAGSPKATSRKYDVLLEREQPRAKPLRVHRDPILPASWIHPRRAAAVPNTAVHSPHRPPVNRAHPSRCGPLLPSLTAD